MNCKSKITKSAVALLLAVTMMFSGTVQTFAASSELDDLQQATDILNDAVKAVVGDSEEQSLIISIFDGAMSIVKTAQSITGIVNGSVSFLKLVGLMKDSTAETFANITDQLNYISDELKRMDTKLDDITSEMYKVEGSIEYHERAGYARDMHKNWSDFRTTYMIQSNNSFQNLMTKFESMQIDGIKDWYTDKDKRTFGGVDNTKVVLIYRENAETGNYDLVFTDKDGKDGNVLPDGYSDCRYLVIPEAMLPVTSLNDFDVDTYRANIENYIKSKIVNCSDLDEFERGNYEGFSTATDVAAQLASDAVDVLIYRTTSAQVNNDTQFAKNVRDTFSNYCNALLDSEDGLDALLKTMYLTHSFEFEIYEDLKDCCNQMTLQTGVYGSFVFAVLGMSHSISNNEREAAANLYSKTLLALGDGTQNCVTGYSDFCYLTNSRMVFTKMSITKTATIKDTVKQGINSFDDWSVDSSKFIFTKPQNIVQDLSTGSLLGDANMMFLKYTLNSCGVYDFIEYFTTTTDVSEKYEAPGHSGQHLIVVDEMPESSKIVTSVRGEETMPIDNKAKLKVTRITGNWFTDGATLTLNSLPSKCTSGYILNRTMVTGSVYDNNTAALTTDNRLSTFALYGEDHFYWQYDESVFMNGPSDYEGFYCQTDSTYTTSPNGVIKYWTNRNFQANTYNCLLTVPYNNVGKDGYYNPVSSYIKFINSRTLGEEEETEDRDRDSDPTTVTISSGSEAAPLLESNPVTGAPVFFAAVPAVAAAALIIAKKH